MEIVLIGLVIVALLFVIFKGFDKNNDGKITKDEFNSIVDLNKDGKVDVADVKVAVQKTKTAVKQTAQKTKVAAKVAVKKAVTKKPPAKKPVTKKSPVVKK